MPIVQRRVWPPPQLRQTAARAQSINFAGDPLVLGPPSTAQRTGLQCRGGILLFRQAGAAGVAGRRADGVPRAAAAMLTATRALR